MSKASAASLNFPGKDEEKLLTSVLANGAATGGMYPVPVPYNAMWPQLGKQT